MDVDEWQWPATPVEALIPPSAYQADNSPPAGLVRRVTPEEAWAGSETSEQKLTEEGRLKVARFLSRRHPEQGDELWEYDDLGPLCGDKGFVILRGGRGGKVVDKLVLWVS
jgi:hypothetical protein